MLGSMNSSLKLLLSLSSFLSPLSPLSLSLCDCLLALSHPQPSPRYNNMLGSMNSSLKLLLKAVKGLVAMSAELDAVGSALFNNQV